MSCEKKKKKKVRKKLHLKNDKSKQEPKLQISGLYAHKHTHIAFTHTYERTKASHNIKI